jgi:hypothetical protein
MTPDVRIGQQQGEGIHFLVIGAQKCGTTSLHMYLRAHPRLYLPPQKEVNFFSTDEKFGRGVDWYLRTYFGMSRGRISGEVSPQYMYCLAAPVRICKVFPNIKLIAVLRNPIDRCFSHYRMMVRRGLESRSFKAVIFDLSTKTIEFPFSKSDQLPIKETNLYLEIGNYSEMLAKYAKHFSRDNFFLLSLEALSSRPAQILSSIYSFLGVDSVYTPPNISKQYHISGTRRYPGLDRFVKRQHVLRSAIRAMFPTQVYEGLRFWYEQLNIKPNMASGPSAEERRMLKDYYMKDVVALRDHFDFLPPWSDFEP